MKVIEELDFSKLPASISDAKIEGKIVALDNLGRTIDPSKKKVAEGFCYPTKTDLLIIVFCMKGSAKFSVNLNKVELKPMHLLVILAGCIFEVNEVSEDFQGVVLLNNPDAMAMSDEAVVGISLRRFMMQHVTVPVNENQLIHLLGMYQQLKDTLTDPENPFRDQMVQRQCQIITYFCCYMFLKSPFATTTMSRSRKEEIFDQFILLVEQNFTKERRITYYAKQMSLTPKYLSTVVKEVSGKYASDWIDDYVVLEAKALLKQGGINIQQISDRLNFPNQSFFGRYFKKQTGYSPKDYRNL